MLINTSETDSKYEDRLRAVYKFVNSVYLAYVDFLENKSKKNLETLIKHCKGLNPPSGFRKYQDLLVKELSDIYSEYESLQKDDFDFKVIDLIANKQIEVMKFVDDVVSLEEVQHAYERLTSGVDPAVKILVDPNK